MIISRGLPNKKYNLNGIFEYDQAKALSSIGLKIVYVVLDMRSIRRWRRFGRTSINNEAFPIEVLSIPCGNIPKGIFNMVGSMGLDLLFKEVLRKYGEPDIIHSHFTNIGFIASKTLNKYNIPMIITEHSSLINQKNIDEYNKKIASYTYIKADKVIAVSKSLKRRILDNFGVEAIVVNNTVDTDLFSNKIFDNKENFMFVSVGRLIKGKNMDKLIIAFAQTFLNADNVKLTIYGEGPERLNLQNLINDYRLSNRIVLEGNRPREVIADFFSYCDAFVLVSNAETFGVAYIEALAAGLPVIATKCGGPEEFVNISNGILIEIGDMKELQEALRSMYNNPNMYDKKYISDTTKRKFSREKIAIELRKVYSDVLNEGYSYD
jgi:glycosyltransferase involved in cell wall biosynthesis